MGNYSGSYTNMLRWRQEERPAQGCKPEPSQLDRIEALLERIAKILCNG